MLDFFRRHMKSTFGLVLTMGFLILIAVAFAGSDIAGTNTFGGSAGGGDRVATVGGKRINSSELSQAANSSLDTMRQQQPTISMAAFVAQGGLAGVLDQMIDRTALAVFGEKHGIIAGDKLVDSEIAAISAFMGVDGKFNEAAYRQTLQQRGLSDALVRQDIGQGLIAKQVLVPAAFGASVPRDAIGRYAALLKERREGSIALIPSAAFAPKTPPSEAELAAFYAKNQAAFTRPERRVIRYAAFDDTALKNVPAPTDAEIAARYKANAAQYGASETRRITQLIAPTEAAARAILAEVRGGKTLESAAAAKGLAVSPLANVTRTALAGQSAPAVADAAFAAAQGAIAGPARSPLGWYLLRVDGVTRSPARTLEQVRGEISTALAAEKRRRALSDFTARIEEELEQGGTLSDIARELGVTPLQSPALTADGRVFGDAAKPVPPQLARVVQTAFSMERENQPQLAELEAGKSFLIFDVAQITPAAPAPLAEVRPLVAEGVQIQKGSVAARRAAERVLAEARKGADLSRAVAGLGVSLPPVDKVAMGREELTRRQGQVPPPLALFFSMSKGTAKLLPAPGNRGFYVVSLANVIPGTVAPNDPLLASAQRELGGTVGREYADSLRRAIRAEVGVERNETAIRAVARQLTGAGN